MPSIDKIVLQIKSDFQYSFVESDDFMWSSSTKTIHHPKLKNTDDIFLLLHEISHAQLKHKNFNADVELVRIETAAWEHAHTLAAPYGLTIPPETIEESLASYRQWLNNRSICPSCQQNGIQTTQNTYRCINCRCSWRANDARVCRLQRTRLPIRSRF